MTLNFQLFPWCLFHFPGKVSSSVTGIGRKVTTATISTVWVALYPIHFKDLEQERPYFPDTSKTLVKRLALGLDWLYTVSTCNICRHSHSIDKPIGQRAQRPEPSPGTGELDKFPRLRLVTQPEPLSLVTNLWCDTAHPNSPNLSHHVFPWSTPQAHAASVSPFPMTLYSWQRRRLCKAG
jgi:hypothetical protein